MNEQLEVINYVAGSPTPDLPKQSKLYSPTGTILIVGLGGLGWWALSSLIRCPDITHSFEVYDEDTFEGGTGATRLPIPSRVENYKTVEFRYWLLDWAERELGRVRLRDVQFYGLPWSNNTSTRYRLLLDCSDAPISTRWKWWNQCMENNVPYVRGSYDGEIVTWAHTPPQALNNDGGYNLRPNMAVTLAAAGMVAEWTRRTLAGENVPDTNFYFGKVWTSANPQEREEIQEALEARVEEARLDAEDPWVLDENGERLGRMSEFELEESAEGEEEIAPLPEEVEDIEFGVDALHEFNDWDVIPVEPQTETHYAHVA